MQFGVGVLLFFAGFAGKVNQRRLVGARREMPVDGVVTEVGLAADEPLSERRIRIIEYLPRLFMPFDQLCLIAPRSVRIVD